MKLSDSYDGIDAPFQGNQVALLRSLPAKAQITSATATVTPLDATGGVDPFAETITFKGTSGDWGATKTVVAGRWVEVDLHNRRTLAGVMGTHLNNTTLQVDLGGAYAEINANGGFKAPGDFPFSLSSDSEPLPGLTVTKFKLTNPPPPPSAPTPDISLVTINSVPSNVNLRLGEMPPFWTHLGEMTQPETTPDFAPILQAFLAGVQVENGFYTVPLVLHSDTIARLKVNLEIEFLIQESVLPEGLNEVTLPFGFNTTPEARQELLQVSVPANVRVAPGGTTGRVLGAFDETRIVYGPTGEVFPVGSVEVSPSWSQAQSILLSEAVSATAVDLLLAVTRSARLQLDLCDDLDGKPGSASLLPNPVSLELPGPVGQVSGEEPKWVSVPLPVEVKFQNTRYWLVLQSIEGQADWSVAPASAGMVGMQRTQDGGLSWRDTTVPVTPGLLTAFFRLRSRPDRFQVPIELQVGSSDQAIRVSMDRFQPLGRVDFGLDFEAVAQAVNQVLEKTAPAACPEREHLANGDFEQWLRDGEQLGLPLGIQLGEKTLPGAVAFKPDGSQAYVASSGEREQGLLQIIDVACNEKDEKVQDISLPNFAKPRALLISPDGTRGYVTTGWRLQVIDAGAFQPLGNPLPLEFEIMAWALSPDGGRLYVTEKDDPKVLRAIDTMLLEQVIQGQVTLDQAYLPLRHDFAKGQEPTAVVAAPDGRSLYVVIDPKNQGMVQIFDTESLQPTGDASISVGHGPKEIALSPDGKVAVVVNAGDNSVSIIDTTTSNVISVNLKTGASPVAVALSPEGNKAYVANQGDQTLSVIDLIKRTIVESIPLTSSETAAALTPQALALIPQGDGVYVIGEDQNFFLSIRLGIRMPAGWSRTSGQVTPRCLPAPFHLTANLGSVEEAMPTALSQVAPVAESCPYEFSFWGLANQPDAVAEVFWLSHDCGLLRTDQIPIEAPPRMNELTQLNFTKATSSTFREPQMLFHRARLMAPTGASQAEVRFSVPPGTQARIDLVSLKATAEAVANPDFSQQQGGQLTGWTLLPGVAPGVSLLALDGNIQLRNAGNDSVELVQTLPAKGGQFFALGFQGRAVVQPSAKANPRIELRWLKADGSPAGSPTSLEIFPTGFKSSAASGTTPADSTQAEIHLVVALGTSLQMQQVSLRFSSPTTVPVTFLAQAPGELKVSNWQVAFEQAEAAPPRLPDTGLCAPTPPGGQPGQKPCDSCLCPLCATEQAMTETATAMTIAGRQALVGRCSSCGVELPFLGGEPVPWAPPLLLRPPLIAPAIIHAPIRAKVTPVGREPLQVKAAVITPLTAISGIGEERSRQLARSGFDTLEKLVIATPQEVVQALGGVSIEMAAGFIEEANRLLASRAKKLEEKRGGANN